MYDDTIAAISTPIGAGGIGIVRLSGVSSTRILSALFRTARGHHMSKWPPRQLVYGHIVDPITMGEVDEVLAAFMPSPYSYTREDVAEIDCHGGPLAVQRVLEQALAQGARLALPGEFTLRAFLNGRLDLSQAEAVMDVVQAKTAIGLRLAEQQLAGSLSKQVRLARQPLVSILAYLTALIDFPEDEVPVEECAEALETALTRIRDLLVNADQGVIYRQGLRVAIVGRPNTGKSSLLNALLRQDRAIVTPIPGTTRDTVEETINLNGIPLVLVDTAGIAKTNDPVELVGMERSRTAMAQADLTLTVVDASQPLLPEDVEILQGVTGSALLVANKSDLPIMAQVSDLGVCFDTVVVSALTGEGLAELEAAITRMVIGCEIATTDELMVTNPRHKDALKRSAAVLADANDQLKNGLSGDLLVLLLTEAVNALGEITGETVSDELLESIFSRFCVGK